MSLFSIMRTDFATRRGYPGKCRSPAVESKSDPRDFPGNEETRQQQRPGSSRPPAGQGDDADDQRHHPDVAERVDAAVDQLPRAAAWLAIGCVLAEDDHGPRGYALYSARDTWSDFLPENVLNVRELMATDPAELPGGRGGGVRDHIAVR